MFVTFVIALREGLEAALIVGIIAGFLDRTDRRALRPMWMGVAAAVLLSFAIAVGVAVANRSLPFRARETMEATLALVAVAGVTYMIVWMRRHGPVLRGELKSKTNDALASGSRIGLVALAFFAVAREGLESAIFLLAVMGTGPLQAGAIGAVLGFAVAIAVGYGLYRGAVHIDLRRFFTATSVVLVIVAAGLVASAFHDLLEAGVISILTRPAIDLSGVIATGSLRASLITAFLGIQPVPRQGELVVWMLFFIPMLAYVLWPRDIRSRRTAKHP